MADSKLTFDADTASYDAKVAASHHKTEGLVDVFKEMAAPLLRVVSIIGAAELAIEGVKVRWETWREQVKQAGEEDKKIGTDLAAIVGGAGLQKDYGRIKAAVQSSEGVLTTEQKNKAIGGFAGSFPGLSADQAVLALNQSQKAAQVIGPENLDRFTEALGLAMQSGLSQKLAGDVAIAVSQSGTHGVEAFTRAAAKFSEENPTAEGRSKADFLKFLKNADTDVFGTRPGQVLGGQALKARLAASTPGQLEKDAAAAPEIDEALAKQREIQERDAKTATLRQQRYGGRAEIEEDLKSLQERARARGDSGFVGPYGIHTDAGIEQIRDQFASDERGAQGRQGSVSRPNALREFAKVRANETYDVAGGKSLEEHTQEIMAHMLEAMRGIHHNTSEKAGAAKFRNDAQDREKSGE